MINVFIIWAGDRGGNGWGGITSTRAATLHLLVIFCYLLQNRFVATHTTGDVSLSSVSILMRRKYVQRRTFGSGSTGSSVGLCLGLRIVLYVSVLSIWFRSE